MNRKLPINIQSLIEAHQKLINEFQTSNGRSEIANRVKTNPCLLKYYKMELEATEQIPNQDKRSIWGEIEGLLENG